MCGKCAGTTCARAHTRTHHHHHHHIYAHIRTYPPPPPSPTPRIACHWQLTESLLVTTCHTCCRQTQLLDVIFQSTEETLYSNAYLKVLAQEWNCCLSFLSQFVRVYCFYPFHVVSSFTVVLTSVTKVSSFQSEEDLCRHLGLVDEIYRRLGRKKLTDAFFRLMCACFVYAL